MVLSYKGKENGRSRKLFRWFYASILEIGEVSLPSTSNTIDCGSVLDYILLGA